jgi:LPXTG-motif cell wall-anchored protein
MKSKERKNRSIFHRSLMAFVIAATPLVAVASFSGGASAAVSNTLPTTPSPGFTATAVENCTTSNIDVTFSVPSSDYGNRQWEIFLKVESSYVKQHTGFLKTDNSPNDPSDTSETFSFSVSSDGTYEVKVELANQPGGPAAGAGGIKEMNVVVDCDRAATDTFTVDPICTGTKGILVTLTSKYNDNSPYDLSVVYPDGSTPDDREFGSLSFTEVVPNTTPKTYNASATFLYGEGDYTVSIVHRITGKLVKYQGTPQTADFELDCPGPTQSSIPGFNFNIPKVTAAPPLPTTGSSINSMLVLAPIMVLLGGGLILARRRLANACDLTLSF